MEKTEESSNLKEPLAAPSTDLEPIPVTPENLISDPMEKLEQKPAKKDKRDEDYKQIATEESDEDETPKVGETEACTTDELMDKATKKRKLTTKELPPEAKTREVAPRKCKESTMRKPETGFFEDEPSKRGRTATQRSKKRKTCARKQISKQQKKKNKAVMKEKAHKDESSEDEDKEDEERQEGDGKDKTKKGKNKKINEAKKKDQEESEAESEKEPPPKKKCATVAQVFAMTECIYKTLQEIQQQGLIRNTAVVSIEEKQKVEAK